MGIRLTCDRCEQFIKVVKIRDLAEMKDKFVICPRCQGIEEKITKDIDLLKTKAEVEFKRLIAGYKDKITEIVQNRIENVDTGE
uniref:Uncharacterized protein n=1 Tax=viral metagenome TaxID=1070528 RepID=A0A6M3IZ94_9ZZZZ